MRIGPYAAVAALLTGCGTTVATHDLLEREVGSTIADATLVAGRPKAWSDLPDGRRAFVWELPALVPTSPERCLYTLYAVSEGRALSLAAWRIVAIEPPGPGCGPIDAAPGAT